ncbi:MAG TPA: hypothetical protein VG106_13020, partial [Vicinamibacterales bacterium]|nr:hypothetical protein [Vicinamibacterales bacterium]
MVRTIGGVDYPVCNVRVQICEVDRWPWLIYRLTDQEIFAIRNDLLNLKPVKFIPRPPIPDPPPDLGPLLKRKHGDHEHAPELKRVQAAAPVAKEITEESRALFRQAADNLPTNIKVGLASESPNVIRQTLANSFDWIQPLIWYWPWFWYHCDDLGTVETNQDGRFTLLHWYPCGLDKPDIYFAVEAFIGGAWQSVYRPPKSTGTHWNYACGTEVTIHINDERVPICIPDVPIAGKKVVVTTIGNNVNVARIQRESAGANQGLTEHEVSLGTGRPFGGTIEPHVSFGVAMKHATNAVPPLFYYRWSYRRLGSSGTFTILDTPVFRRYMVEPAGGDPEFRMLQLGPVPGMPTTMFMVPPQDPFDPAGPAQWEPLNLRTETASAFFPTNFGDALTNAGKYELLLELFDAAGNLIPDWVAAGIEGYIPDASIPAPFPPVTLTTQLVTGVPAMSEYYRIPAGMGTHGMRLVVHVDNNACTAVINPIASSGFSSVDNNCGFYVYTDLNNQVTISFVASHPNNFATFDFDVTRGASNSVGAASADGRAGASPVDGFNLTGGQYTKNVSVGTLLEGCPNAAFAETLGVTAMVTDGWNFELGLSRTATPRAFALSNS